MKKETKLKQKLATCKDWAEKARTTNEEFYLQNMGLLYMQVAIEQIIEYLEIKDTNEK
jgi:hypothetical protein